MRWILAVMMVGCTGENVAADEPAPETAPPCPAPDLDCPDGARIVEDAGLRPVSQCRQSVGPVIWQTIRWPGGELATYMRDPVHLLCWQSGRIAIGQGGCWDADGKTAECSIVRADFAVANYAAESEAGRTPDAFKYDVGYSDARLSPDDGTDAEF